MGLSEDSEDAIGDRFQEVCADLNMDRNASEEAWQSFRQISTNYTLEGDKINWLACALYVACRRSVVPTVSRGNFIEGNCVSLTRLLRSSKLSLIQFFKLMKKWADMANLPPELRNKVEHIERNFAVSTVIFKKFEPIFNDIFKNPNSETVRAPRSRKQKRLPCSSSEMFSFCWTLFVCVKAHFRQISDDLVNSYHLLLSIMDLFYSNVLLANRKELLNPGFSGLPENFHSDNYEPPNSPPCIIQLLCQRHEGLLIEAKSIKEHWCRPHISRLFEKNILRGDSSLFCGLLDPNNFESNSKAINKQYEEYVLSVGDFDERIFLGYDANVEIGTVRPACPGELTEKIKIKRRSINEHVEMSKSLTFQTPLTGKKYLEEKESCNVTPVSTATQSVNKLQTLLSGCKTSPSEDLMLIFSECSRDPSDFIINLIKKTGEIFSAAYAAPSEDHPVCPNDFARKRLQLGESLYYKILEKIVKDEKSKRTLIDLTPLFEHSDFHKSLFACCLEIVLFSYNSMRKFPWIINIFGVSAYQFYKVIEVLIRAEEGFSRDVVKNLKHIEEQILESLAWKSDSPLWDAIKNVGIPLPSVEDVSLPSQLENHQTINLQSTLMSSPVAHPAVKKLAGSARKELGSNNLSGADVTTPPNQTFQSPPGAPTSAKRQLFPSVSINGTNTKNSQNKSNSTVSITVPTIQDENGITYVPISTSTIQSALAVAAAGNKPLAVALDRTPVKKSPAIVMNNKPKKTGSVALFMRKVFYLISVRLRELCDKLRIENEELRKMMWTCIEYCLRHHPELMKDRHLDQIIMCSVYVMAKVTENDQSFQDIMKYYRMQPQAASHVYRAVLLNRRQHASGSSENRTDVGGSGSNSPVSSEREDERDVNRDASRIRSSSTLSVLPGSQPPTPTRLTGTESSFENEDRGDIITFYNSIFVKKVKEFAVKFSPSVKDRGMDTLPLSPLPKMAINSLSPRKRVSHKHSVFISPLKNPNSGRSPHKQLTYSINASPHKYLDAINNMVKSKQPKVPIVSGLKRALPGSMNESVMCGKRGRTDVSSLRKIKNVINERQNEKN